VPSGRAEAQVRPGVAGDLSALTDISNHDVRETPITFDTVVFPPEERRPWLLSHLEDGRHRLMVAVDPDSQRIPGYATSSAFRPEPAYTARVGPDHAPIAVGRPAPARSGRV